MTTRTSPSDETLRRHALASATLAVLVGYTFAPAAGFEFIDFDDPGYVTANPHVRAGLTGESIAWAFTHFAEGHYHPLTWLSHMLDVELFGLAPGPHHVTNIALHALGAVLAYLVFATATGRAGPSFVAAALYGLHPLRCESVAWVSERKDVLSALFFWLATLAWLRFAKDGRLGAYAAAFVLLALGLLAKPTLVTLPIVWLLLDRWPLDRWPLGGARREALRALVVEKLPFLALSIVSAVVVILAQREAGAMPSADGIPVAQRLANAGASYLAYVGHLAWPAQTSIFHPFRPVQPGLGLAAWVVVLALTWRAITDRRHAALRAGWLWYVVTMLPVIGIVQVGAQSMADRWTLLPSAGLFLGVVLTLEPIVARLRPWAPAALATTATVAALLATRWQLPVYRDTESVFSHALAIDPDNFMAHNNLGVALEEQGRHEEADLHFREAQRLNPGWPVAQNNLGLALAQAGDLHGAIPYFEAAVRASPRDVQALYNLGLARAQLGELEEAERRYREVLAIDPDQSTTHFSLGALLVGTGRASEGVEHLERAAGILPDDAEIQAHLARGLLSAGRVDDARAAARRALVLEPSQPMALEILGRIDG